MLGGETWVRQMKRELPDLMYRIQILGQKKGAAKDGFYSNFDIDIHGYTCSDIETYDLIADKRKGRALDVQNWPTDYETERINLEMAQRAAEDCSLDVDVDYNEPLRIAIDCNANLNCMIIGQTRTFRGHYAAMVLKTIYVQNEQRLRSLCKNFTEYFRPHLRRNGNVIFYYTSTIKQGGSTPYAVEEQETEQFRFDNVVVDELEQMGWTVTRGEIGAAWKHERKHEFINDCFSFRESPVPFINQEAGRNDYLIVALENAGIVPGTFRKDKSREKNRTSAASEAAGEFGIAGDPRTRTDVTDAFDDFLIGCKTCAETVKKLGGKLRGRFRNISGMPR